MDPKSNPPVGDFVGVDTGAEPGTEPRPEDAGFMLKASLNGKPVGYVGLTLTQWCILSDTGARWSSVPVPGSSYSYFYTVSGPFSGRYLSVSDNAEVGLYSSGSAVGWMLNSDGTLVNNYNNQNMSVWSVSFNGSIYAWNAYQVLTISMEY